eukprot:scaffold90763_cov20-Tisochrysis_lutea.AAC.1
MELLRDRSMGTLAPQAFTVGSKLLVGVLVPDVLHECLIVVQLAVDSNHDGAVLVEQRLVPRVGVHDGEALMREEVVAGLVQPGPAGVEGS